MLWIIGIILLLCIDIFSKMLATAYLKNIISYHLIEGVFNLTYTENRGAAFGIMQNMQVFLVVVTTLIVIAICAYWVKTKPQSKWFKTSLMFIIAGALGNLIDRAFYQYVVDFLQFKFIDFPVFNMADVFVVTGVIMLAIYIIFIYKEPDEKGIDIDE